jgi:protein-S-isoprenylcysteine O-methyltransferase Ste14
LFGPGLLYLSLDSPSGNRSGHRKTSAKQETSNYGTIRRSFSYICHESPKTIKKSGGKRKVSDQKMKEATDILKIVGMILLVLFVLAVGVPLVLAAAGVALGIIGTLVGLAIALIKIAVVVAIIYLIVVGLRAVLR